MKSPSFRLFVGFFVIAVTSLMLCVKGHPADAYEDGLIITFENETPEDSSTGTTYQPTNVSLTWQCTSGDILLPMVGFDVHYGTKDTEFNESHLIGGATIFTPKPDLEPNTIYYWRVDAFDGEGHFWPGPLWQFTTGSARGEEPAAPELKSPSNGESDLDYGNLSLVWEVKTGMRYNVFLTKDGEAEREIYIGVSGNVAVEVEEASTYFWRVVGIDNYNIAKSSEVWAFSTSDPDAVPDSVSLVPEHPANMASEQQVLEDFSLAWSCTSVPESNMASFDVHLGRNASEFGLSHSVDGASTIYTPGQLEPDRRYFWQVTAHDGSGNLWRGPLWTFTTEESDVALAPLVNLTPSNPGNYASEQPLDSSLIWSCTSDSEIEMASFDVRLGKNADELDEVHSVEGQMPIFFPNVQLAPDSRYFWQVTAYDGSENSWRSDLWQFTTAASETLPEKDVEIVAQNPGTGSISQPTDQPFLWNVSNLSVEIVSFEVHYGRNSQEFNEPHRIDGPLGIYSPQTDLQTDRTYFWQVTALDADGKEWRSPIWQFETGALSSGPETPSGGGGSGGGSGIPGAGGGCSVASLGALPLLLIPLVVFLRR